jgi:lipopolysaccharide export LptBFGC system permease protein LptF
MPSLVRFLVVVLVLAALVGAATFYLANFVEPRSREMTVRIPPEKLAQPEP